MNNKAPILLTLLISILCTSSHADGDIDITGIDRAKLIQALHKRARVHNHGSLQANVKELPLEEAQKLVGRRIDYLHGAVMKLKVPSEQDGNSINAYFYDRDNGQGAAQSVVESLRSNQGLNAIPNGVSPIETLALLQNGQREPRKTVVFVLETLNGLVRGSSLGAQAVQQLHQKAINIGHEIPEEFHGILASRSLYSGEGPLNTTVRNIVQSAIEVTEGQIKVTNPFAPDCEDGLDDYRAKMN